MGNKFGWTCPFCNHTLFLRDCDYTHESMYLRDKNKHGKLKLTSTFVVCPNDKCQEVTLISVLYKVIKDNPSEELQPFKDWRLLPSSSAKVFPAYIPKPIIDDYTEACLIKDISPKASATLSRRCLQGIIRDFWELKKTRLIDEIEALENKVDPLIWKAIDSVRSIGNIGAHMEKDINLILDIEPNEAELLINLIEMLLEDWYIERHERQTKLQEIIDIAKEKESKKKNH